MKKLLSVFLAGALAFSLAACGDKTETDIDEPSGEVDTSAIEQMTLEYGQDVQEITIYKPQNASFTNEESDHTDLISISSDDMSWWIDVWGSTAYDYGAGEPFVYYYYKGELDEYYSETLSNFTQTVTDLGVEFNGKAVKKIESTYTEDGEEQTDTFIGFEFEDKRDGEHFGDGLLGFQFAAYDEIPSDAECANLFKEVFGVK